MWTGNRQIEITCQQFINVSVIIGYPISVIDLLAKDRVVKSEMRD